MKITTLYVYPIKALRGIELKEATITPQGIKHDRRFMLFEIKPPSGQLKKMQLSSYPQCALFEQQIIADHPSGPTIAVRYHPPPDAEPHGGAHDENPLLVPLEPGHSVLEKVEMDLHGSGAAAYRMGDAYDAWFTSHFGFAVTLLYIGDGKRPILGTSMLPKDTTAAQPAAAAVQNKSWISSLTSYLPSSSSTEPSPQQPWLTFTDVAPLLVTSESSLRDVSARLPKDQPMDMYKFRPNLVVDGEGEAPWAEDFWAELAVVSGAGEEHTLVLTGNCGRCTSLNVDYEKGRQADGELGSVLKKLMGDRRVDTGTKWSPIFGRYAFPGKGEGDVMVEVGDEVRVVRRNRERSVWDWP
ncbi:molybdenum cofactor sulfurase, partial [Echria macrotheca]